MSDLYDTIVIGVGAMGSSACYHLAKRGQHVMGLEQFTLGHALGSSHGESRMIRLAYYEHPDYVPLLRRAYALWRQIEAETGRKLLHVTGGLYAGPPDGEVVAGSIAAAEQHGLAYERLTPKTLEDRFGEFRLPPGWPAIFEPEAGFLLPELSVRTMADLARRHGATLHETTTALGWDSTAGGELLVRTTTETFRTKKLVVCGGAWSGRLLRDLGMPLVVTRQIMGWVRPHDLSPFALGRFPVWAVENLDGTLQYGFPVQPGTQTLKVSWHGPGSPTDPDAIDRSTSGADVATFLTSLPHLLPAAAGPVADVRTCLYTMSPDHHFIIDQLRHDPRVTFACGFSGHGFKFASVVGEILADLSTDGRTRLPTEFLRVR